MIVRTLDTNVVVRLLRSYDLERQSRYALLERLVRTRGVVVDDIDAAVAGPPDWPTDVAHVAAGGVSLSPLQPELFWRGNPAALPELPDL